MNAHTPPRSNRLPPRAAAGLTLTLAVMLAAGCGAPRKAAEPAAGGATRTLSAAPPQAPAATTTPATPAAPGAAAPAAPAVVPVTKVVSTGLPTAAVRNVAETFFGTTVDDPYRHFEDTKNAEVATWMKAHSDFAAASLKRIPGRAGMIERITRYDEAAAARVTGVARAPGDLYFYEQRNAADNQYKLVVRQGLGGTEKVLVDPGELEKKTGKPHAINYFSVSPDARHVAYGLSQQGSEEAVLHVLEVASGKPVGQPITRANFGAVDWSADGKLLFFSRLQELKPGMGADQKYQHSQMWRLPLGAAEARAVPVFGTRVKGPKIAPADLPFVSLSPDGRWAFGFVVNGTQREFALYAAPQASLRSGTPQWKPLFGPEAEVTGVAYQGGKLYMRSHKDAPRFQLLSLDVAKPDITQARLLVPQSERMLNGIAAAADALYLEFREGNTKRLFKRAYADEAPLQEVKLPVDGAFRLEGDEGPGAGDVRFPGLLLDLQSWTRARQIYEVAADGSVRNTGLQPGGPYDAPDHLAVTEARVKSHDGALVPLSIIHRKGIKLDGRNPTLLYGYASYGITEEPYFSTGRLAWLDAGGVLAVANPRGSSVYGHDWYKSGFQASKPNTWKDFIACAEYLVAQKYTTPARLGILGGSAGGILVGRAMTEWPDLFAAVVPAVGALDMVRAELTPNGVPNIPEFGSRSTEAGFKALLAMSTYHQVKDGTKYPAVMLTHGVNDPRVEVWHSSKTAARLMAASTSGRPVLLRLDYDAGHGVGSTKRQQIEERADIYSFLLWQMGVEGYQPK